MTLALERPGWAPPLIQNAINAELDRLRNDLRFERHMVCQCRNVHWGWWPTAERERYTAIRKHQASVRAAEKALRKFISDYRAMMGPEWIGNNHGRLCWTSFIGGLPIDHHYCGEPEGHDGNCSCEHGAWKRQWAYPTAPQNRQRDN